MVVETIDCGADPRVAWLLQKTQFCLGKPIRAKDLSAESKQSLSDFINAAEKTGSSQSNNLVIYVSKAGEAGDGDSKTAAGGAKNGTGLEPTEEAPHYPQKGVTGLVIHVHSKRFGEKCAKRKQ